MGDHWGKTKPVKHNGPWGASSHYQVIVISEEKNILDLVRNNSIKVNSRLSFVEKNNSNDVDVVLKSNEYSNPSNLVIGRLERGSLSSIPSSAILSSIELSKEESIDKVKFTINA